MLHLCSELLEKLTSAEGEKFNLDSLQRPIEFTSASGDIMVAANSCQVSFGFDGVQVKHCLFVLDVLAVSEKLILGMDFLTEFGVCINMCAGTITLPHTSGRSNA